MDQLDQPGFPDVATAEDPVPNWGRLVRTDFGTAAWNKRDAGEISQTIPHHLVLFSFAPFANRETRLGGTRIRTASATSGMCEIVPAGADYWARWHEHKEVAAFALSERWLDKVAQDSFDLPSATVMSDALPVLDRRVAILGEMLRDELRCDADTGMPDLQLDSLLNLLGFHLLKQYGARSVKQVGAGLSDRQFRRLRDYMSANFAGTVKLDDIASVVGLSSSQLLRTFRQRTGTSPHQYLTRMRLDHARTLILGGPMSLAEIALTCGFSSQSHLTSVMRREDGLTPGALRA
ncbi:hypothetical protein ASG60_21180 [Methylobacterium sp. Leaf469]|uniref:helix-turn-helix domain-containing protein n=1 Tax=Methylobacterium sp. Leaf469 TaxID=1736387 RepID=UPI0006F3A973|nr:AraC family transcriptional regulator [Methylobacterium sp. Leaf469]KQT92693.1 hypothetical protein ASG60_21180 [Methylobacterium sp. Leaf469]